MHNHKHAHTHTCSRAIVCVLLFFPVCWHVLCWCCAPGDLIPALWTIDVLVEAQASGSSSMWYCNPIYALLYCWWPLQGRNAIRVSKICQRYNTRRCPGRDDVLVQMVPSCWHGMSNRWSYLPRRSSSLIWSEMILVLIAKIVTDSWFHISSYSCPTFVFPITSDGQISYLYFPIPK